MTSHSDQPAFQEVTVKIDGGVEVFKSGGMTLRDYFAAKAMQGLLASDTKDGLSEFAQTSYRVADAMLKARG